MDVTIRAVLFDCDGVLQRPSNDWVAEIGALTGLAGGALSSFLDDISEVEQHVIDGSHPYAVELDTVLRRWELPVRAEELLDVWQHVSVDPGMLGAVEDLRAAGVTCALGTNQHPERAVYMRRELGYDRLFEPMIISAEIGTAKPDADYFRHAVDRLGLPAGQVLFVDDVGENVDAARGVGLVAELFARDAGRVELDRILALHGLADPVAA